MKSKLFCPQHEIRQQNPLGGEKSSAGESIFVNTQDLKPNNPDVDTNEMGDVPAKPIHRK